MELSTEGVLVLASARGLEKEYAEKEFDYDFPEGLAQLLAEHAAVALTTESGDELLIDLHLNQPVPDVPFDHEINQYLYLQADDELLVLSHADFTQICAHKKGDYTQHRTSVEKIDIPAPGLYHVNIRVEDVGDRFDDLEAYFRLSITLNRVEGSAEPNTVSDISA